MSSLQMFEDFLEDTLPELTPEDRRGCAFSKKWEYSPSRWGDDLDGKYCIADAREHSTFSIPEREILYLSGVKWWIDDEFGAELQKIRTHFFKNVPGFLTVEQIPKVLDQRNPSLPQIYFEYLAWRLARGT